jgi:hypothetical protein
MASNESTGRRPGRNRHADRRSAQQRTAGLPNASVRLKPWPSICPIVGHVNLPRPEELAYHVGLTVLPAAEIIDWPVALVLAAGHALNYSHHSRVANELGDVLDEIDAARELGEALDESGVAEEIGEALAIPPG